MKRLTLITAVLTAIVVSATAQVNTWRAYMSYHEPQQIVKAGSSDIFVRASNGLYQYNLNDQSITTFDKVRQLSDTFVQLIAWNQQVKRLIVVYQNSNIDLIDLNQGVTNISSLYYKSMMQDKTVNSIYIYNEYAYLATNFGVVKLNMQRAEIAESYILNAAINAIAISNGNIYVRKKDWTVLTADMSKNLIDLHNWTTGTAPAGSFVTDTSDWDQYIATVQTLQPNGPKYNQFGYMKLRNGKLFTTTKSSQNATVQVLDSDKEWTLYEDDLKATGKTDHMFINLFCVDQDPTNSSRVIAAGQTGVYEFVDGQFVKEYNNNNSPIQTASTVGNMNKDYVMLTAGSFDNEGNYWCFNSISPSTNILELKHDGTWQSHFQPDLMHFEDRSFEQIEDMMFDSRGIMWFVNNFYRSTSFAKYDPKTDHCMVYKNFSNQDGTSYTLSRVRCVAEDHDGNIWVGTKLGPFYLPVEQIDTDDDQLMQVKVPRNDGTNYADYLLNGADISDIAIDSGNRKWFATYGNGVYLISADNMEQIYNFTENNSPLLSNSVETIAINHDTGEVFFGTDKGLCSFMSDATNSSIEMDKDHVYAYPNPVVSGYDGLITVVGLSFNSDVKILSTSGQLIAQGRSNGGTFTWNGCDSRGRRVASGVYMVAAATSEGKKGVVCKIAVIH